MHSVFEIGFRKRIEAISIAEFISAHLGIEKELILSEDEYWSETWDGKERLGISVNHYPDGLQTNLSGISFQTLDDAALVDIAKEAAKKLNSETIIGDHRKQGLEAMGSFLSYFPDGSIWEAVDASHGAINDVTVVRQIDLAMKIMERKEFVDEFKAGLVNGSEFVTKKINDLRWAVESKNCVIWFIFERYQNDGCSIFVSDPKSEFSEVSIVPLRHLRQAKNVSSKTKSPENLSGIFNKYFFDILCGNFDLLFEFKKIKAGFGVYLMEALNQPDESPIKVKALDFDISWLSDLKASG